MNRSSRNKNTPLTPAAALARMERYCAYQDRCHSQVRAKLREFPALSEQERENIICLLIENRFLDEERFACSFARGKHRFNRWGRLRIERELRARDIPPRLIATALAQLDPQEYRKCFLELFRQKEKETGGLHSRSQIAKVYNFMVSHGYEPESIWEAINVKRKENTEMP